MKDGKVIWITGLSEAGKTTLAKAILPFFPNRPILLDGDEMRAALGMSNYGYEFESRRQLSKAYGRLALLLSQQGFTVVLAVGALFHEVQNWNRQNLPGYVEIFLDVPEDIRRSRDSKGLYAAVEAGRAIHLVGRDVPVEFPLTPDLRIEQDAYSCVEDSVRRVVEFLGIGIAPGPL